MVGWVRVYMEVTSYRYHFLGIVVISAPKIMIGARCIFSAKIYCTTFLLLSLLVYIYNYVYILRVGRRRVSVNLTGSWVLTSRFNNAPHTNTPRTIFHRNTYTCNSSIRNAIPASTFLIGCSFTLNEVFTSIVDMSGFGYGCQIYTYINYKLELHIHLNACKSHAFIATQSLWLYSYKFSIHHP